jgi:hypothetical protein
MIRRSENKIDWDNFEKYVNMRKREIKFNKLLF